MMVNIGNMMKQAQQLQKKMAEVQEKLNSIEVCSTFLYTLLNTSLRECPNDLESRR